MWKAFAIEVNRQIFVNFLLYEGFPVAKSPINVISIVRVSSDAVLVRVVCTEKSLPAVTVTKAALYSCPHWELSAFLVTLLKVFIIICNMVYDFSSVQTYLLGAVSGFCSWVVGLKQAPPLPCSL